MNDQNKFVNAYIEASVATIHDYLNQLLQTKAQLKVTTEIVSQLQNELQRIKAENDEKEDAIQKSIVLENTNNALQNKVSHLETALNQIAEMKRIIISKGDIIKKLETQIDELKSPKKVINRKKTIQANVESVVINKESELAKTDDF